MAISAAMPRLGESVSEGTVTRWLKAEGDRVEADEPLLEVSTDKVDTEIPSPASGVLSSIKVAEDETVDVGTELAQIDEGGSESGDAKGAEPEAQAEEQQPEAEAETELEEAKADEPEADEPEADEPEAEEAEAQEPEAEEPAEE